MTISELTLGVFKDDPFAALDVAIPASDHPHPRTRIRMHILARLRAAAAQPARVLDTATIPTDLEDELPLVLLYALREGVPTEFSESPRVLQRTAFVVVHAVAAERDLPTGVPLQDVLDAFARVVELLVLNDRGPDGTFFGEQAADCSLGETDIQSDSSGERVVIHARVSVRILYQDEVAVPADTKLQVVNVNWDLAPPDGRFEAQDRIALPIAITLSGAFRLVGDMTATIG